MKLKPLFLITTALVGSVALAATVTPNMSLLIPSVGDSDYPASISNSFSLMDLHDHSPGKGVPISPAGIPANAITTAKIADGAVTASKVDATLTQSFMPPGAIIAYGGASAPAGWLLADGTAVNKTGVYAALFAAIQCSFGCTTTQFNVPDLRGRFLRGRNGGATEPATGLPRDPDAAGRLAMFPGGALGDNVGTVEVDAFGSHNHTLHDPGHTHSLSGTTYNNQDLSNTRLSSGGGNPMASGFIDGTIAASSGTNITLDPAGGNETRPKNVNVNYIVKY